MIVIQNWVVRFGHVDTHRRETWADSPKSGAGSHLNNILMININMIIMITMAMVMKIHVVSKGAKVHHQSKVCGKAAR